MKRTFSVQPLPSPFRLTSPEGAELTGTSPELEVRRVGGQVFDLRLRLTLEPAQWQALEAGDWCHLAASEPGPTFGGALDPHLDVVVELRATPDTRMLLSLAGDTDPELAEWLAEAPVDGELRRTHDWQLAVAKQQHGDLFTGFRTRFFMD